MSSEVAARLRATQERMATSARAASRDPASVQLLAVSKGQTADKIRAAYLAGQQSFGENYAQELFTKAQELKDLPLSWHFIGHLQSNKIAKLVALVDCIQTVASFEHAEKIAAAAKKLQRAPFSIYLEVNAAEEAGKSGVALAAAPALAAKITRSLPELRLEGLMAVPPASFRDEAHGAIPKLYKEIKEISKGVGQGRLSLGMSADLGLAIAAGSTLVRIGTGIFGERAR